MIKTLFFGMILALTPAAFVNAKFHNKSATITPQTYGQVMIHTADGATYVVTGNLSSLVYQQVSTGDFVACMVINGAIGLPPATNDIIFKDNFESVALCFPE